VRRGVGPRAVPARMADAVLASLGVEAAWLLGVGRGGRALLTPGEVGRLLAPGMFLVLSMRAALSGRGARLTGPCLMMAGVAHLVDLRGRRRA